MAYALIVSAALVVVLAFLLVRASFVAGWLRWDLENAQRDAARMADAVSWWERHAAAMSEDARLCREREGEAVARAGAASSAVAFLRRLVGDSPETRGRIVSSADCSAAEIAQAQACGRFHADADGMGYVLRPGSADGADLAAHLQRRNQSLSRKLRNVRKAARCFMRAKEYALWEQGEGVAQAIERDAGKAARIAGLEAENARLRGLLEADPAVKRMTYSSAEGLEMDVSHWAVRHLAASLWDTFEEIGGPNFSTLVVHAGKEGEESRGPLEVTVRPMWGTKTPVELLTEWKGRAARLETALAGLLHRAEDAGGGGWVDPHLPDACRDARALLEEVAREREAGKGGAQA